MNLDKKTLLEAYRQLKTIREFEMRMRLENEAGQVPGFIHLYCGQEAVAVGACMKLEDKDYVGSTHRGHGHCIAKGCDIGDMLLEIFCKQGGLCNGKGGSMHIVDMNKGMLGANAIVGAAPPIAVGAALTAKTLKTGGVAMAFIGDGASNQGTTLESYNLASVWNLPAIFVVEDNGYAETTASDWSVGGSQVKRAEGFGMPGVEVNGHDFFAVCEVAKEAIDRARAGEGPSLIHARLDRHYGHFEGDAQTYRAEGEQDRLKAETDCLKIFRRRVTETSLLDDKTLDDIDREVASLIGHAVTASESAPPPSAEELLTDVYVSY